MIIKRLLEFFKNKGYHIVQDDITTVITVVDMKSKMIISHTVTGSTIIAFNTDSDIRFRGMIKNVQQLKMIIELVS